MESVKTKIGNLKPIWSKIQKTTGIYVWCPIHLDLSVKIYNRILNPIKDSLVDFFPRDDLSDQDILWLHQNLIIWALSDYNTGEIRKALK